MEAMEVEFNPTVEMRSSKILSDTIESVAVLTDTVQQDTVQQEHDCAEAKLSLEERRSKSESERLFDLGNAAFLSETSTASTSSLPVLLTASASSGLRERRGLRELSCETKDLELAKVQAKRAEVQSWQAAQVLKSRVAEAGKTKSRSKSRSRSRSESVIQWLNPRSTVEQGHGRRR
jgi:hypothetical protein